MKSNELNFHGGGNGDGLASRSQSQSPPNSSLSSTSSNSSLSSNNGSPNLPNTSISYQNDPNKTTQQQTSEDHSENNGAQPKSIPASSLSLQDKLYPDGEPNQNLFVNYLPSDVLDSELNDIFQPYGQIESAKVMMDLTTGHSRCYGFVKFRTLEQASAALQAMNGYKLKGKSLIVKFAAAESQNILGTPSPNVYVKGIPHVMSLDQLKELFSVYGSIIKAKIVVDQATQLSRGMAFINFTSIQEAENSVNALNGKILPGTVRPILVKFADNTDERKERRLKQQRKNIKNSSRYTPYGYPTTGTSSSSNSSSNLSLQSQNSLSSHNMSSYSNQNQNQYPLNYLSASQLYGSGQREIPHQTNHLTNNNPNNNLQAYFSNPSLNSSSTLNHSSFLRNTNSSNNLNSHHMSQSNQGGYQGGYAQSTSPTSSTNISNPETNIFIYHLPSEADDTLLYKLFSPFGAIESVKVMRDAVSLACKGFGFVKMKNWSDAFNSIQALNGYKIGDKHLSVAFKK